MMAINSKGRDNCTHQQEIFPPRAADKPLQEWIRLRGLYGCSRRNRLDRWGECLRGGRRRSYRARNIGAVADSLVNFRIAFRHCCFALSFLLCCNCGFFVSQSVLLISLSLALLSFQFGLSVISLVSFLERVVSQSLNTCADGLVEAFLNCACVPLLEPLALRLAKGCRICGVVERFCVSPRQNLICLAQKPVLANRSFCKR